jgi:glycosyltransferase involved in cell wall biosynthesis
MLLEQTRPPNSIVFCDKSNDETRELIQSYKTENYTSSIEIIEQTGNGVADAYNEILDYIQGNYDLFATIQTDLIIDENWLSGHINHHQKHPEIDLITGSGRDREPTDGEVTPDERSYYTGRNFSAKAGTLERIDGWDTNFLRGEDWDMRIRLASVGTRVYTTKALRHDWQKSDPYVTLSKAKRKPTSVTFLSKYGLWYARFHPSHVISDALSLASILSAVGVMGFLPFSPTLAALSSISFTLFVMIYWISHVYLRGGVHGSLILGPTRKQLLNGIAVLYAYNRVIQEDISWNMTGFDPENVPRYKF